MKTYLNKMRPKTKNPPRKKFSKILWSALGSFLGIYFLAVFGKLFSFEESIFLLGSFGASAVLIYGAPEAPFSQPRNLIGGHMISAFVAVALVKCCQNIFSLEILCALGVALAVLAMHLTRTVHPPGGATALIYVMGTDFIQGFGWLYPFAPIGVGALIMLLVALLVNNLSSNEKRHYPQYWI
ncbi:MAG: HPP family protein [Sulfurovum sp.]|nr:HPP family protein [Sulfurovum sp.]